MTQYGSPIQACVVHIKEFEDALEACREKERELERDLVNAKSTAHRVAYA